MNDLLLILIFIAVGVTAYYMCEAVKVLKDIRYWAWKIHLAQHRPPKPPKPKLLKERVYKDMGKIYFPFLLPAVPDTGKPVKRVVSVAYNGEIVKRFENVTLKKSRLDLWPDEGTEVSVTTYTVDAAGNISDASTVTETALDVFPPPAPPKAELLIDELKEVEDDDAGEIEIVEITDETPVEPEPLE